VYLIAQYRLHTHTANMSFNAWLFASDLLPERKGKYYRRKRSFVSCSTQQLGTAKGWIAELHYYQHLSGKNAGRVSSHFHGWAWKVVMECFSLTVKQGLTNKIPVGLRTDDFNHSVHSGLILDKPHRNFQAVVVCCNKWLTGYGGVKVALGKACSAWQKMQVELQILWF